MGSKLFCEVTVQNSSFKKTNGKFGDHDQRIGSIAFDGSKALTGSLKGELYSWAGTSISGTPKKLHTKLIDAITVTKTHVLTGARDSKVSVLDKNLNTLTQIDLSSIQNSNST